MSDSPAGTRAYVARSERETPAGRRGPYTYELPVQVRIHINLNEDLDHEQERHRPPPSYRRGSRLYDTGCDIRGGVQVRSGTGPERYRQRRLQARLEAVRQDVCGVVGGMVAVGVYTARDR